MSSNDNQSELAGAPGLSNTKLYTLLEAFQKQQGEGDTYRNVLEELLNGNAFLLLTSQNEQSQTGVWKTTTEESTINLTCVQEVDGLKVLAAFTDEASLLSWTKQAVQYTGLAARDVLKLCEDNQIDRIVINSNLPNMYILERRREDNPGQSIKS